MSKIADKIYLFGTYLVAVSNIVLTFDFIKSVIIFIATMVLLIVQIKLHLKRLRKENENDEKNGNNENPKKN